MEIYETFRKEFKLFEDPEDDDLKGIKSYKYILDEHKFEIQFKDIDNDIFYKMLDWVFEKNISSCSIRSEGMNEITIYFKRRIRRIMLFTGVNFLTGTTATLYGIKAA